VGHGIYIDLVGARVEAIQLRYRVLAGLGPGTSHARTHAEYPPVSYAANGDWPPATGAPVIIP